MKRFLAAMLLAGFTSQVSAEEAAIDVDKLYFGGGISDNDLHGQDATGLQFLLGYPLEVKFGKGKLALEAGYMDSGRFNRAVGPLRIVSTEATGFWGTMVGSWKVADRTAVLGRFGLDIGDDDGLMYGVGLGYDLTEKVAVRGEYVLRDNIDSLQFNFVFR